VDNSEEADTKEELCFDIDSEELGQAILGEKTARRVTVKMV
jgi:hypothetical protein